MIMHDDEAKQAGLERLRASGVLPGQIYRHYKGGEYTVIAVGLNEPDLEPLVHYRDAADPYATVWTRQLNMFTGRALVDDTFVTRFERIT